MRTTCAVCADPLPEPALACASCIAEGALAHNWLLRCRECLDVPTVTGTRLCGPCTFGDQSTYGGNWEDPGPQGKILEELAAMDDELGEPGADGGQDDDR